MLTITDPRRITEVVNTYDNFNRVSRQRHADGGEYAFYYFSPSTPVRFSPPVSMSYVGYCGGSNIRIIREGDPVRSLICGIIYVAVPSKNAEAPQDSTATNAINQTMVVDPKGSALTYRFDGQGYPLSVTDAMEGQTIYERQTGTNLLKSITDKLGRKTAYTHDANGNVITVTDPAGNVTRYEYDPVFNKPIRITDALGNVTVATYDSKGNLIELTTPKGEKTIISYNSYGKPAAITDALSNTTLFEYDAYGNLTRTTDPLGNSTTMQYDPMSRLLALTDQKGKTTKYSYDLTSRITAITDALGSRTRLAYDANGNLASVIDAKEQTITYTYNVRNKVAGMTDQVGRTETYEYDLSDNLVSAIDRKGQKTIYAYDLFDHITQVLYADGAHAEYQYDAGGRLTYISDSIGGPIQYVYDNRGCSACGSGAVDKIVQEITALGSLSYAYDAIGRRTSMTVAGQPVVNYGYDANNRLTSVSRASLVPARISYDALGRRTSLTLPNGVITDYSYDTASNLLNIESLNPLNQILERISYAYDNNGGRTKMDRQNMPVKLPNPVSNTSYNAANQMLSFNDKNIAYDANGNMTTVTNSCGTTTYSWNARNQLTGMAGFNADCLPLTASFKYDAMGRRIEKTVNGKSTGYLYDGLDIIQEIEDNTVSSNYIRTLNIDEPLVKIKSDGTIRYYHQDALGSVIALADETGVIRTQYNYDPFGNTEMVGEMSDNPFQYTGRENDGTGTYYYRSRYYSPEMQRFISEDPIRFEGEDVNFFSYVGNNPVNWIDPMGLKKGIGIGTIWDGAHEGGLSAGGTGELAGTLIGSGLGTLTDIPFGGVIGGMAGGLVGSMFDDPGASEPNYDEPIIPSIPSIRMPPPDYPSIHMPPPEPQPSPPVQPSIHMPRPPKPPSIHMPRPKAEKCP